MNTIPNAGHTDIEELGVLHAVFHEIIREIAKFVNARHHVVPVLDPKGVQLRILPAHYFLKGPVKRGQSERSRHQDATPSKSIFS